MQQYSKNVPDRLKEARALSKVTQEEIGETLGLTPRTIFNYENGKSQPKLETLEDLAGLYKINFFRLFDSEPITAANAGDSLKLCENFSPAPLTTMPAIVSAPDIVFPSRDLDVDSLDLLPTSNTCAFPAGATPDFSGLTELASFIILPKEIYN